MNQWLNPSHPRTLQAAVILGYLSAVFGLLSPGSAILPPAVMLLIYLALGVGAFASANNKRWGYVMLAATAGYLGFDAAVTLALSISRGNKFADILFFLNASVFPVALAAAALHAQSREYQRIWFE